MKTILLHLTIILLLSNSTHGQNWYYNQNFPTAFRAKYVIQYYEFDDYNLFIYSELIQQGKQNRIILEKRDLEHNLLDSVIISVPDHIIFITGFDFQKDEKKLTLGGDIWSAEVDKSSPYCLFFNMEGFDVTDQFDALTPDYDVIRNFVRLKDSTGFIGTGYSTRNGNSQVYLRKSDNICQTIWEKVYGPAGWQDAHSVTELRDGGFMIGAWVKQVNGYLNLLLIRTDSLGVQKWSRQYGGMYDDGGGRQVLLMSNGNVLVTGSKHRIGDIINDNHIMEVRPADGSVVWEKQYGHGEYYSYFYTKAIELENKDFVVGGIRNLFSSEFNGIVTHSTITRLDSKGKIIWDRVLFLNPHHLNIISQQGLKQAGDGGYWLFGYMHTDTQDGWLIKVDSLGCPYPDCDSVQVSSDPFYLENEPYFRVGPVPAINEMRVYYKFPYEISAPVLEVFDLQGRKLYRIPLNGYAPEGDVWMDVSDWAHGMYFMQIVSDHKVLATRKVMVGR